MACTGLRGGMTDPPPPLPSCQLALFQPPSLLPLPRPPDPLACLPVSHTTDASLRLTCPRARVSTEADDHEVLSDRVATCEWRHAQTCHVRAQLRNGSLPGGVAASHHVGEHLDALVRAIVETRLSVCFANRRLLWHRVWHSHSALGPFLPSDRAGLFCIAPSHSPRPQDCTADDHAMS